MDEEETKLCPNCKREIPGVNFTTHAVHCARNIRVCPVCKEPVPLADLQRHHDELHKQLPCKQCGESVCGTDLEDHIRDSCAHTIKSCRFCELELPRGELPAHEGYCGVRTEQCPECREWVMIKYRQLHLDSNHGFIRLDDDPVPTPRPNPITTTRPDPYQLNLNRPTTSNQPSTSNGFIPASLFENFTKDPNKRFIERPERKVSNNNEDSSSGRSGSSEVSSGRSSSASSASSASSSSSGVGIRGYRRLQGGKPPSKRTNDQPQININSASSSKVDKDLGVSRGAVKKRVAPKPPPFPLPTRDLPYYSALQRRNEEERLRQEQNAYNLSVGLPPVLDRAAKLEKLRKMDALQNREVTEDDYKHKLRKDFWSEPLPDPGFVLGSGPARNEAGPSNIRDKKENGQPKNAPLKNINNQDGDVEMKFPELENLKPMTPKEFLERFNRLQMREDPERADQRADRFSEIKSSLRELRRGLNEVTAPYNANNAAANIVNNGRNRDSGSTSPQDEPRNMQPSHPRQHRHARQDRQDRQGRQEQQGRQERQERQDRQERPPIQDDMQEVRLPCEFCGIAVPMDDLVQHQTGCRPDLAQYRVEGVDNATSPALNHNHHDDEQEPDDPVIPCEFCARSLPVYLISEHQERCGRESNLLFAD